MVMERILSPLSSEILLFSTVKTISSLDLGNHSSDSLTEATYSPFKIDFLNIQKEMRYCIFNRLSVQTQNMIIKKKKPNTRLQIVSASTHLKSNFSFTYFPGPGFREVSSSRGVMCGLTVSKAKPLFLARAGL